MNSERWSAVDDYISNLLIPEDDALAAVLRESDAAGLPSQSVSAPQGKLLGLLVSALRAERVLEIGTLGGYSAIWMARALSPSGRLMTLEVNPKHADVARKNFRRAGVEWVIDLRLGPAAETLGTLRDEESAPFDLVFIDADKPSNPEYFSRALELTRPGGVILVDNVVRGGEVIDPDSQDDRVQGVRRLNEMISLESRVSATEIQTVGSKGHDGFAFVFVRR